MATLVETLQEPTKARAIVADGVVLIDSEVRGKRGVTGLAIKAGYKTVKRLRSDVIEQALAHLLPEFAPQIDPFYAAAQKEGNVRAYFLSHAGEIAEALLSVTDAKAKVARSRVIQKAYLSLRPQGRKHTMEAVPGLADLVEKHVG